MEITNLILFGHVRMKNSPDQIMAKQWQPSPSTWMCSLFPSEGLQRLEGILHGRVTGLLSTKLGVGGKVRKGENPSKKFSISMAHAHTSKLTGLMIVNVCLLLFLLSPAITNRQGT